MLRSIAVVVFDGVAPFEFGLICEVFGLDRTTDGVPAFDFRVAGPVAGRPVTTSVGAQIVPDHDLGALAGADLVAVPAIRLRDEYPPDVLDALRAANDAGAQLLSVCSGAFVLAAAGILDGKRVTTHWMYAAELASRHPSLIVDPDVLYVDDGTITTSAGTAAGIDACLHVVRRELGSDVANIIARRMVVAPQRDGGQRQFIERPVPECTGDGLAELLDWVSENLDAQHSVRDLARRARMSERTFARTFVAQTGTTPAQWIVSQRVNQAQALLEQTTLEVEEVARRCGFASGALLRHHFRRLVGVTPVEYRQSFRHAA